MENKNAISMDIASLFDAIITKGSITGEVTLGDNLNILLKVLDTGELLAAEAEATTNHPFMPDDIVSRGRIVSILTAATVSLNGIEIEQDNLTKEENRIRKQTLFKKYMALPVYLVDKAYAKYKELQEKQQKVYTKPIEELEVDVENF